MNYTPKIKKEDLIHGNYYYGGCRNATVARWDAINQVFTHWRNKFGHRFVEEIRCPEDDKTFDVFVTECLLKDEEVKEEIPFRK
jgi:hypothetical protein